MLPASQTDSNQMPQAGKAVVVRPLVAVANILL